MAEGGNPGHQQQARPPWQRARARLLAGALPMPAAASLATTDNAKPMADSAQPRLPLTRQTIDPPDRPKCTSSRLRNQGRSQLAWWLQVVPAAESLKGQHTACPACKVAVQVTCRGGHEQQMQPCCSAQAFSCDRSCGQPLACGNHSCSKPCHEVPGAPGFVFDALHKRHELVISTSQSSTASC